MTVAQVIEHTLLDEEATIAAGLKIGGLLSGGVTLYLEGQLGAGKTTLTRGIVKALGHSASVKSPTYTLVEPYEDLPVNVYHFDLYRLGDPEELSYFGVRDYFRDDAICIVEWPMRGLGFLPEADIRLELCPQQLETGVVGRKLTMAATTEKGKYVLSHW